MYNLAMAGWGLHCTREGRLGRLPLGGKEDGSWAVWRVLLGMLHQYSVNIVLQGDNMEHCHLLGRRMSSPSLLDTLEGRGEKRSLL